MKHCRVAFAGFLCSLSPFVSLSLASVWGLRRCSDYGLDDVGLDIKFAVCGLENL